MASKEEGRVLLVPSGCKKMPTKNPERKKQEQPQSCKQYEEGTPKDVEHRYAKLP